MIRYRYRKETGSLGTIARPVANVIFVNGDLKVEAPMYIDSGADLTMIPLRFGRALGLQHSSSESSEEFPGVGFRTF